MNAQTGASGILANGATAAKITADTTTTNRAIRRAWRPAGSVDRNIGRWSVSSCAMPRGLAWPSSGRQGTALEKHAHLGRGHRTGEIITLRFCATVRLEEFSLLGGFDAFCRHLEHQFVGDGDNGANDGRIVGIEGKITDKGLVDFE